MWFIALMSSRRTLIILGVWTLILQLIIASVLRDVASPFEIIKLQVTFSRESFFATINTWTPQQLASFLRHYNYDLFYPIVYSCFLASALLQFKYFQSRFNVVIVPILVGLLDQIENHIQLYMVSGMLPEASPLFYVGAAAASLKWLLVLLSFALLAWGYWKSSGLVSQTPSKTDT